MCILLILFCPVCEHVICTTRDNLLYGVMLWLRNETNSENTNHKHIYYISFKTPSNLSWIFYYYSHKMLQTLLNDPYIFRLKGLLNVTRINWCHFYIIWQISLNSIVIRSTHQYVHTVTTHSPHSSNINVGNHRAVQQPTSSFIGIT